MHNSLFSRVYLLFTVFYCFDLVNTSIWWTKGPWHQLCNTPWGQFELDIFPWTFVNETFIYDKSNILQTSCQIKLWNFLLQLEMTKKSLNFLSEIYIFRRHCVEKIKTNWLQIGRSRWPELNFSSLCSKIWSQCDHTVFIYQAEKLAKILVTCFVLIFIT